MKKQNVPPPRKPAQISIRKATEGDLLMLGDYLFAQFRDIYPVQKNKPTSTSWLSAQKKILAEAVKRGTCLVAAASFSGSPLGYCVYTRESLIYVKQLAGNRIYDGKIEKLLLQKLATLGTQSNAFSMCAILPRPHTASADKPYHPKLALYQSLGFEFKLGSAGRLDKVVCNNLGKILSTA